MYVVLGVGRKGVGDTPEEATRDFEAAGGRGPAQLIRTPASVTRDTIDEDLRRWHSLEPADRADDDDWVMLEPGLELRADSSVAWAAEQPPRTVPGYRSAVASGLVTLPPELAPKALPGIPANVLSLSDVFGFGLFLLLAMSRLLPTPALIALFACLFGWVFISGRLTVRRRDAELAAGYITLPVAQVAKGESSNRELWDFRGTWQLRWNGEVLRAPDRSLDAPGYYPSPSPVQTGRLQLWTGAEWLPQLRDPEP